MYIFSWYWPGGGVEADHGIQPGRIVLGPELQTWASRLRYAINNYDVANVFFINLYYISGIMKLVMTCTIVDSMVVLEDITDAIERLEDFVQSVNVASMNKIS